MTQSTLEYDVAIIGGSLIGSMAAIVLQRRGLRVVVLESRRPGEPLKAMVGEAITEGTSLFLRHEIGLSDWLMKNALR